MRILLLTLFTIPLLFVGCSSDDDDNSIKLEQDKFVMNYSDTKQINATSKSEIVYSTESEYVAKVSDSGMITAGRVGETNILLTNGENSKNVSVTVEPKYDLFPEPIGKVKLGDLKTSIKTAFGTPDYEDATGMIYNNYYKNYAYMFLLENNKITSMSVVIPTLSLPDNLASFLSERYLIVSLSGYTSSFINEKKDMAVGLSPSDNLANMFIMYFPFNYTYSETNNTKKKMIEAYLELSKCL